MRNESKSKGPQRCAVKERNWRRTFQRFEKSGSSVRAFCLENGIAEHQFYAWRREITRRDRERSTDASNEVGRGSPKRRQAARSRDEVKMKSRRKKKPRPILTPLTIVDDTSPADERRSDDVIELIMGDVTIRVSPSAGRESLVMILDVLEDRRC